MLRACQPASPLPSTGSARPGDDAVPRMLRSRAHLCSTPSGTVSSSTRHGVPCAVLTGIDTVRKGSLQDHRSRHARRPPMFLIAAELGCAVVLLVGIFFRRAAASGHDLGLVADAV